MSQAAGRDGQQSMSLRARSLSSAERNGFSLNEVRFLNVPGVSALEDKERNWALMHLN